MVQGGLHLGGWRFARVLWVSLWPSPPQGLCLVPPSPCTLFVPAQVDHGMGTECCGMAAIVAPPTPGRYQGEVSGGLMK